MTKSNEIIIDFIGDDYIEYSDFWKNTYEHLTIESQILYDTLHSELIYDMFDEIKLYIRENIDHLDLTIYDYYLLHYLIPDKESLKKYVLNKMGNITDNVIDDVFNKIEELKNKQGN